MPLTYSIAYGLLAGIGCYFIMSTTFWLLAFVGVSKPVFYPPGEDPLEAIIHAEDKEGEKDVDPTGEDLTGENGKNLDENDESDEVAPRESAIDDSDLEA